MHEEPWRGGSPRFSAVPRKNVPNLCGSGVNERLLVLGKPVSGRFDQRYAMGSKKSTGSDFILVGSNSIGFEFIANGVLGGLLSSSLG